ncbi:MAG: MFS transporter [Dehalococcoidia bacterium]
MKQRAEPRPLRSTFSSLRIRNYRLYFSGQLVSQIGTWMQSTALSWYVLSHTHSALALGAVSTFQFLPVLLFALLGGVIADRVRKQRLLIGTQTVLALQAIVLATLTVTGLVNLPLIYLLAAVQGTANALNMPAQQSFVIEMVGSDDVANAIGLNSSMFQLTRLVGPALGGIVLATLGAGICFYINAASYIAVLISLFMLDSRQFHLVVRPRRVAMLRELGDGLYYAVTTPDILLAIITMAVLGTFGYNFQVFTPLIAQFVLHTNAIGYGLLTSSMAIGSLVASLAVAWRGEGTRRAMLAGAGCFSGVLFAIGLSGSWYLLVPLFVGLGLSSSVFTATNSTRLQMITPPHLRGRVMSINTLLFAGSTPIGSLIVGGLGESIGVQPMMATMGGLCLLGVAAALAYQHRVRGSLIPERADLAPLPVSAPFA